MTDASPGLCKYYEYVLSKIDSHDNNDDVFNENNFPKEAEDSNKNEEVYEELLADMDIDSNSIH